MWLDDLEQGLFTITDGDGHVVKKKFSHGKILIHKKINDNNNNNKVDD